MGRGGEARERCYIASPLGFNEAGRDYYRRVYIPALETVVEPVDPWPLEPKKIRSRAAAIEIGRENAAAIRSCSLLVAYLDGQEIDAGTAAEVGFAAGLEHLRCFGLRSDDRQTGEPPVRVNLQVESFILDSGGEIFGSLGKLLGALGAAAREICARASQDGD